MQRLRHPIRSIREPFGKAGLTVAVIALVFAMVGGAWAAVGLNGKQKKEVKTIAKSFQGTGPAGAAGTNGTNGKDGAAGTNGTTGSAGTNGKSVVIGDYTGVECATVTEEGATVEVEGTPASKKYVCNGEEGAPGNNGAPGSPWTAGGTLPVGSTETGNWAVPVLFPSVTTQEASSISFPIPLAAPLAESNTLLEGSSATFAAHCKGTPENPAADSGYLCVYTLLAFSTTLSPPGGANVAGTFMSNTVEAGGAAWGTWAVTG